jgi:hypothetical protein
MKNLYTRSMLALACAATLVACGGKDDGNLLLGGNVVGLYKSGLQLKNGSATVDIAAGATAFSFATLIPSESSYDVSISLQPKNAVCSVVNGTGKASNFNITTVGVSCKTDQYALGGNVAGLTGAGLILNNGSDSLSVAATATSPTPFVFATKVDHGSAYGVTVRHQPEGQTCAVVGTSGNGEMAALDVSSVQVSCAP